MKLLGGTLDNPGYGKLWVLLFVLAFFPVSGISQTAGLIFEPAGSALGQSVLDPNGDGYVSKTINGFQLEDRNESEIPYVPLIFPDSEPSADINNGPDCGFTDFVESADEDPGQNYFDANGNWLFRLRMGSVATNAKSYSILVDANELFGAEDPNYTETNPGFEFEIVLATKFGVYVYDLRASNLTPSTPVISYPGTGNYQKSVAYSTICGTTNYFLDFFVDMDDISTTFSYDETTPFRIAIVSNMAANKSTICNISSASDLGGVDNACGDPEACFTEIIENQLPCSVSDVNSGNCLEISAAPVVNSPINNGDVDISGTCVEADGTVIDVFVDGVYLAGTTLIGNVWNLSGISALVSGQEITALATAPGKAESSLSNTVVVGAVCTGDLLSVTDCGKGISGTSNLPGATIRVYQGSSSVPMSPTSGSLWNVSGDITVPSGGTFYWKNNSDTGESTNCTAGGGTMQDGAYRVTQQLGTECESSGIWVCVGNPGTTADASISTSPVTTATNTLTGNVATPDNIAGVEVFLYVDDVIIANTTTTAGGAFSFSGLSLSSCEKINVMALGSGLCASNISPDLYVSGGMSETPSISGDYCTDGLISTISGTCKEADGTLVQVYNNGVADGTPATVVNGQWTVTDAAVPAGNTITARATALCKTSGNYSAAVPVNYRNGNIPVITSPVITEGDMSVSGTGTDGDMISLYIDDYPVYSDVQETIPATALVSGGAWTVNGIYPEALYAGGILTARASSGTSCDSDPSAGREVQCLPPASDKTIVAVEADYCQTIDNGQIIVRNSDPKVIYTPVLADAGNTVFGYSALGDGNDLVLRTYGISSVPLDVTVSSMRIGGAVCESVNVNTDQFNTLYLLPADKTITASKTAICNNEAVEITIANTESGVSYSLIESSTGNPLGSPVTGDGNDMIINTGGLTREMDIEVRAGLYYSTPDKTCETGMSDLVTITADPGCTNVLPVELIDFTADCWSGVVNLSWSTVSESNNELFVIEKSYDGENFFTLTDVLGSGNSSTVKRYVYSDDDNAGQSPYYRLIQVDNDGTETMFQTVFAGCSEEVKQDAELQVFPNPFRNELSLSLFNITEPDVLIEVTDYTGRVVFVREMSVPHSDCHFVIKDMNLDSGLYLLRVKAGNQTVSEKIQKL